MNDRAVFSPTAAKPTLVRYGVLGWFCALSMVTYIDRVCIKEVEGDIERALGITNVQFGWILSAFGLSYALFEVPTGWLGDRLGPRRVLTRVVLWWSVFTALTGCVWRFSLDSGYRIDLPWGDALPLVFDSFVLMLMVRFLFGAGEAGAYPNIARGLRNWFPFKRRGQAQGLLWMFGRFGGAAAVPLIWLFSSLLGWRGSFGVFALLGAAWTAGFYLWFRDTPREHGGVNDAELDLIEKGVDLRAKLAPLSWRAILRSPTLWCLCLMYFCSNAGWCFFITWDKKYHENVLELTDLPLKLATGSPLFFGGVACMVGGLLTDRQVRVWGRRWGRTMQIVGANTAAGVLFLLAVQSTDPWLVVPLLCLASFAKDLAMASCWATCIDIGHKYSGTVSGFMNMVGNLGTFFSPPIVAVLMKSYGTWAVALSYSGTMFLGAALFALFINPRRVIVYAPDDERRLREEGTLA